MFDIPERAPECDFTHRMGAVKRHTGKLAIVSFFNVAEDEPTHEL
jgi:hypothetical protein